MEIRNYKSQRNFLNLKSKNIALNDNGVYLLVGENGSGKTTFFEEIIFSYKGLFFNDEELKYIDQYDKYNLFSYFYQKVPVYDCKVIDYIKKYNVSITNEAIENLLNRFSLGKELLNRRFDTLSGGEQVKTSLISVFLKNTPYIFLDEPSNNLDDGSTAALKQLILEEAKTKRIFIISHDDRIIDIANIIYEINNNEIVLVKDNNQKKKTHCVMGSNKTPYGFTLLKKILFRKESIVLAILMFVIACLIGYINYIYLREKVDFDGFQFDKNYGSIFKVSSFPNKVIP